MPGSRTRPTLDLFVCLVAPRADAAWGMSVRRLGMGHIPLAQALVYHMVEVRLCGFFVHVLVSLPNTTLQVGIVVSLQTSLSAYGPYLLTETMLSLRNVLLALCFNAILCWAQTGATAMGAPWQSPNCTVGNMKIRKEWYAVPNSSNA